MPSFVLRVYQRSNGLASPAQLLEETAFEAENENEAISAARVRLAISGKKAEWARLRGPQGAVLWYADGPFA